MHTAHTSTLPFKDNLLRIQIPTWVSNLACTSDQFHSSWRSGPNHTPRIRTGPSLQWKGPGRVSLLVQAPKRKPSLLSKLTLEPAIRSYSATAFFTTSMSFRPDTKTDISKRGNTWCKRASKRDIAQSRICPLNIWSRGSKAKT